MAMEPAQIERLREEQELAIQQTKDRIAQMTKYKTDYEALRKRLNTLPDKVTHEVMVPFGSLAFMPGQLVHTNEILVLLGDSWFAERSAKQASEIVTRRIEGLEKQIADIEKQLELLTPRLSFTSQLKDVAEATDVFEIKEEYDPQKEKKWKEQHKKNVAAYRRQLREESSKQNAQQAELKSDEEIWQRLEQLQLQERRNSEMQKMEEIAEQERKLSLNQQKEVKWSDFQHTGQHEEESEETDDPDEGEEEDDDEDEEEEEETSESFDQSEDEENRAPRCAVIRFSHSASVPQHQPENTEGCITSPSDIYKMLNPQTKPKSILKKSSSTDRPQGKVSFGGSSEKEDKPREKKILHMGDEAFHEQVVEKVPVHLEGKTKPENMSRTCQEKLSGSASGETVCGLSENISEQPKKVSRFKAQRMKQGNS